MLILLAFMALPASARDVPLTETIGTLRFVESVPEETALDLPGLEQAHQVWPRLLGQATRSLNVASFYFSRRGDGKDASGPEGVADRLAPIIHDLQEAGERGCRVRVLGDGKFFDTYPEALTWLGEQKGVASRHIDAGAHWGGVMHAKYFVVDDETLYVGSQNWDWRALTQIHELGAQVKHPRLARQLRQIFDLDWKLAETTPVSPVEEIDQAAEQTVRWDDCQPALLTTAAGDTHNTARAWLSVLETSYLCTTVPAWHANLRKQLVKRPKLHFYDTGLVCTLLGHQQPGSTEAPSAPRIDL